MKRWSSMPNTQLRLRSVVAFMSQRNFFFLFSVKKLENVSVVRSQSELSLECNLLCNIIDLSNVMNAFWGSFCVTE